MPSEETPAPIGSPEKNRRFKIQLRHSRLRRHRERPLLNGDGNEKGQRRSFADGPSRAVDFAAAEARVYLNRSARSIQDESAESFALFIERDRPRGWGVDARGTERN